MMNVCVNEGRHQSDISVMFTEEEARIQRWVELIPTAPSLAQQHLHKDTGTRF